MYMQLGHCPRCGNEIHPERIMGSSIVCECGWTKSVRSEVQSRKSVDRTCAAIVIVAGFFIAGFLHFVNWDNHSLEIIPLKIQQISGSASVSDLNKIAAICTDRKKYDCTEKAFYQIARKDPRDLANLARLADLQFKRQRFQNAADTLTLYFSLHGDDLEAGYNYAQTLTKLKKYDQADRYYQFTLNKKSNVLQVSVIRSYVQMLMEADRFEQAKNVILTTRKKSASANMFMAQELEIVREKLGEVKTAKR